MKNLFYFRDAGRIADVYKLTDILSDEELNQLKSASSAVTGQYDTEEAIAAGLKAKKFTELFAISLRQQVNQVDETKLAVAMFMEATVKFLNMRAKELADGPRGRGIPDYIPLGIRHKVFNLFQDQS
jgi:hypothetical protein